MKNMKPSAVVSALIMLMDAAKFIAEQVEDKD